MSLRYNMVRRIILSVYFHNCLFYMSFHTIFHFLELLHGQVSGFYLFYYLRNFADNPICDLTSLHR